MVNATKLVFSNYRYVGMAVGLFTLMFVLLSALSEYVFFEPYFVFYVADDRLVGFALIIAVSALTALVIPMNVYRVAILRNRSGKAGGGLVGALVGISAGACSCGPVGFAIISTFGTVGGIATSFLTAYEIPLRLVAVGILGFTYFSTTKSLSSECRIKGESA